MAVSVPSIRYSQIPIYLMLTIQVLYCVKLSLRCMSLSEYVSVTWFGAGHFNQIHSREVINTPIRKNVEFVENRILRGSQIIFRV